MAPPGGQRHGMSAAAQEALAKPVGLNGCAAVAASPRWGCRRIGARVDRGGGDVGCACCQWSSGHPRRGTLVRHFMCGGGVDIRVGVARDVGAVALSGPQCGALAPALGACGVADAPTARALVTAGGLAPGKVVRLTPAGAAAIPVAAIAAAAHDDLNAAPGAQEQAGWAVQRHHQTEPVVLDGVVPAGHTAVAPPSSARCRARRSHQAARRERAAAAPTFFGIGRLYRASRRSLQVAQAPTTRSPVAQTSGRHDPDAAGLPELTSTSSAWPPCRAARQTHSSSISRSARNAPRCSSMKTRIRVLAIT